MADIPRNRAVYRLLTGVSEKRDPYRALIIGGELTRVVRWMLSGSPDDYPTGINAEWVGDMSWRAVEFSPGTTEAPIVGPGIAERFRADFEAAGELQPLHIDGEESKEWFVFLVKTVVDCLDTDKSSEPEWDGTIRRTVFRADAVPYNVPAFRVPRSTNVHWNGWMVDKLMPVVDLDVEARLIWTDDPTRRPHPDPWSF